MTGHVLGGRGRIEARQVELEAFHAFAFPERTDRLFRGSGLYRPKWDERHYGDGRTYGDWTLDTAFREEAGDP